MSEKLLEALFKKKKLTILNEKELKFAVENLNTKDIKFRFFIGDLILHQGKKSIKFLVEGANNTEPEIRRSSIYLLGNLINKHSVKGDLDLTQLLPVFYNALDDEDPKVRKNSIIALGNIPNSNSIQHLLRALSKENVDWIRPSIILSLGSIGNDSVLEFLNNYKPINDAENEALRKAIDHLTLSDVKPLFKNKLIKPVNIELWTASGLEDMLLHEIDDKFSLKGLKTSDGIIRISLPESFNIYELFKVRCFSEILFPLGSFKIGKISDIASDTKLLFGNINLFQLLLDYHDYKKPVFKYRLEIRNSNKKQIDRKNLINSLINQISEYNKNLINSAGDYDIELRFIIGNSNIKVLLKPFTIKDLRFAYRVKDVPASIKPIIASGILMFVKKHFKPDGNILDPFCGSSTMLIERAKLYPYKSLTGVDIAKRAIDASKENMKAAGLNINLIFDDIRNINKNEKYDEIISNMPFGLRVGNHKQNVILYNDFLDLLPDIMEDDGYAMLFTQEIDLMMKALGNKSRLSLDSVHRIDAGGLNPGVFIITKYR